MSTDQDQWHVVVEETTERRQYATFEKLPELRSLQNQILAKDPFEVAEKASHEDYYMFQRWTVMLAEYQEQAYLLDPFLEELVTPVVSAFKEFVKAMVENPDRKYSKTRAEHITMMLYEYVKFRGQKAIIRYFPHEIADLSIALAITEHPDSPFHHHWLWAMRYVTFLWLSLIVVIPFDLAQFDDEGKPGTTSASLQRAANQYLDRAGLDREAAALLLSRIYMRKDVGVGFHEFVESTQNFLKETKDVFKVIGTLQVLCEVSKSGSAEQIQSQLAGLLDIATTLQQSPGLTINTIIRKYRVKLISRVGLRLLPGRIARQKQVRTLSGDIINQRTTQSIEEHDVPEELEGVLEHLFEAVQDKDTVVRWSAAKGVARVAERLPVDYSNQVLETLIGLFEIHSLGAASLYDLPAVAESTWHGACLACAEMARRNLVDSAHLPKLIEWLTKALYFDLRKGAHSIGSNVRDSAAYVLWALARAQDQVSLAPFSHELARHLATAALFDREVHIRRAASAAFQEHVGRTSLFPHGIDVLGKMDFYAVSVRKNAFVVAAPQVAEHIEYRPYLVDHILNVVLRHWEVSMREVGSQALRLMAFRDPALLESKVIPASANLLASFDGADVHGGLLALTEIAIGYRERNDPDLQAQLRNVFNCVGQVQESVVTHSRNELVAAAVCRLIGKSITESEVHFEPNAPIPYWRKMIDIGLKHRGEIVQEAAADALAEISSLTDYSVYLSELIKDMKSGPATSQQSLARVLSVINYNKYPAMLPKAIDYLLESVKPKSKATIETRRSCYDALPRIFAGITPHLTTLLSPDQVNTIFAALIQGLDDYTIDDRGDVGSWVRLSCIRGLTSISAMLMENASTITPFDAYFTPQTYHQAVAGILKQGVERLDNVRQEAGVSFTSLLKRLLPDTTDRTKWQLPGHDLLNKLFDTPSEVGWQDGGWLFPRAFRLLEIAEYRHKVLSGLVVSIGSRTDSIQRPVASSLVQFAQALPPVGSARLPYSLLQLIADLIQHAKSNMTSNTIVIPVFQAFNVLFDDGALNPAVEQVAGLASFQTLLHMASKNIDRMKNVQRIHEAMKVSMNLLAFDQIRKEKVGLLRDFLGHPFPRVRAETAEFLFSLLQTRDIIEDSDDLEAILLETEWVGDIDTVKEKAEEVVTALQVV